MTTENNKRRRTEKNEMLVQYERLEKKWPEDVYRLFDATYSIERRKEMWEMIIEDCDSLRKRYAWVIPDERAIRILQAFGSVVEVGAGKGYWASLIATDGTQVKALDLNPPATCFFPVLKGGPDDIGDESTLFLCYPDDMALADADDESNDEEKNRGSDDDLNEICASIASLGVFSGDTVILAGESFFSGTLSADVAPWGRSLDSGFQVLLATSFHMVLLAELPSWPISRDVISVWKRTKITRSVFFVPAEECGTNLEEERPPTAKKDDDDEDADKEDDEGAWANIPPGECIQLTVAAPDYKHLLL
mmetsp:Transcript_15467/g.20482  ORF Transcript_15467/g.20482 Transcript_15467/m.20482 type:complete len:306 (+) Transcript_15467:149-1066(+)|eukprot:CAMPEP_0197297926 /NCGR_PEP_ID=MMETSP0890-20130614/42307_1 /TAXON_ID=44058 ORGANISM="Aureoumbra lagunensis, Strain CCMP1510" /NCGR_SAMPLE_ID=MMETSP0890 /ASSEMBLY_ACC=CAM_ASM_000533 /LENGTH=305 /DNA_ID=CAMNT_0042775331 /DNA_START=147 /DNA_END=1064 /DNA_ORIENTATION=-